MSGRSQANGTARPPYANSRGIRAPDSCDRAPVATTGHWQRVVTSSTTRPFRLNLGNVIRNFLNADFRLGAAGLDISGRRIILYAPTWKGTNFNRPDDARKPIERIEELNSVIDTERYVVLLKTHQVVHAFAAHDPPIRRFLVPNEVPTKVVLGITDILVTDYSNIFFDFLATGRPIAFLVPDIGAFTWPLTTGRGPLSRPWRTLPARLGRGRPSCSRLSSAHVVLQQLWPPLSLAVDWNAPHPADYRIRAGVNPKPSSVLDTAIASAFWP